MKQMHDAGKTQPLVIKLFGGLVIEKGDKPVTGLITQKAELLVAYLACHPRSHSRERLATMLWDGRTRKQALSNLRTLLTSLRRHLHPYLVVTPTSMALDWDQPIWVDATTFEREIGRLTGHAAQAESLVGKVTDLQEALSLYRGDFLEGVFIDDSQSTEAWIAASRERLHQMAILAHEQLATHFLHHRRFDLGARYARELVRLDPLRESAHRLLMRLLARSGRHNAALSQYETCRNLLQAELGVTPATETIALRHRIARARAHTPDHLPATLTPFVGRTAELAAISRRLDEGDCRLLTLVGTGGAGKTRLALESARERRYDYLDGVYFVNLAPVGAARSIPQAIAAVLDLPLVPKRPLRAQLLDFLRDRELLLLLDNFEHLLDPQGDNSGEAVELVQAVLETAPDVNLLVTSRHRLGLQAESVLTVHGLQTGARTLSTGNGLEEHQAEAPMLFISCARRVRVGFDGTGENAAAIARICRLVDGLPLAIEMAAASVTQHQLDDISARISRNLDFLAASMRDLPPRHRTLRATFDHSWALLDASTREAFRRLTVFRGPFDVTASTAVAGADEAILNDLVARSLLQRQEGIRYEMHQVLRRYALEKLSENPKDKEETRDRHSTFTLLFLRAKEPALYGTDARVAQQSVFAVLDDVHAAWEWAVQQHNWRAIEDSLEALTGFHSLSGVAQQGQRLIQAALNEVESAGVDAHLSTLGARLMASAARLLVEQGRDDEALATAERALAAAPPPDVQIAVRFQAGRALWRTGRFEEAQAELEAALTLCTDYETSGSRIRGEILRTLGITTMHRGDYEQAEDYYSRALKADRSTGSRRGEAIALNQFGRIAELQGDFHKAQQHYEQALPHFQNSGFRRGEVAVLINLGNTLRTLGAYATARDHLRRALSLARQINDRYQEGLTLYNLGILHHLTGDLKAAERRSEQALHLVREAEYKQGEGNSLYTLSSVALSRGDLPHARRLAHEALVIYREIDSPYGEASAHTLLGRIALRDGRLEEAQGHFETALSLGRTVQSLHIVADAMIYQSLYMLQAGETKVALSQARESVSVAQETGVQRMIGDALTILGHAHVAAGENVRAREIYSQALALRRDSGQHHLAPEPLAGLAHVALALDNLEQALVHVEEILAYLDKHRLQGPEEPTRILDICRRVLTEAEDPRASSLK